MPKSAANLWAADPLFMGIIAAWPLVGEQPSPQVCGLAVLDKEGEILFDSLIRPDTLTGGGLQTRLIPAEHIKRAPTIDKLWGNLEGMVNRRDVVLFNQRLARHLLWHSAAPYNLPALPYRLHSLQELYLDHYGTAFTVTNTPSLALIQHECGLEHMTLAISQRPDQFYTIHHAVNEAETCRRILAHLASLDKMSARGIRGWKAGRAFRKKFLACTQATADEEQQGDPHEG
jgi:hypothetical protein